MLVLLVRVLAWDCTMHMFFSKKTDLKLAKSTGEPAAWKWLWKCIVQQLWVIGAFWLPLSGSGLHGRENKLWHICTLGKMHLSTGSKAALSQHGWINTQADSVLAGGTHWLKDSCKLQLGDSGSGTVQNRCWEVTARPQPSDREPI